MAEHSAAQGFWSCLWAVVVLVSQQEYSVCLEYYSNIPTGFAPLSLTMRWLDECKVSSPFPSVELRSAVCSHLILEEWKHLIMTFMKDFISILICSFWSVGVLFILEIGEVFKAGFIGDAFFCFLGWQSWFCFIFFPLSIWNFAWNFYWLGNSNTWSNYQSFLPKLTAFSFLVILVQGHNDRILSFMNFHPTCCPQKLLIKRSNFHWHSPFQRMSTGNINVQPFVNDLQGHAGFWKKNKQQLAKFFSFCFEWLAIGMQAKLYFSCSQGSVCVTCW